MAWELHGCAFDLLILSEAFSITKNMQSLSLLRFQGGTIDFRASFLCGGAAGGLCLSTLLLNPDLRDISRKER